MKLAVAAVLVLLWILRGLEIRLYHRNRKRGRVSGRGKAPLRIMIACCAVINAFLIAGLLLSDTELNPAVLAAGAALLAGRTALKALSVRALHDFWSAEVEIREDHRLVRQGPYRFLRHPAYLANILEAAAYPIMAHSPLGLAAMMALVVPAHVYRIWVEEGELERKFGAEFVKYRKSTAALIPYVI